MALPKPYSGKDVSELEAECEAGLREHARQEPREDLDAFNPTVKQYGVLWSQLVRKDSLPGIYVVAGISGNMTGVPIAHFDSDQEEAASQYAKDFGEGKCFTIQNDERWCDYINAALDARRSFDLAQLLAKGRKSGISCVSGMNVSQAELKAAYVSGKNASEI